MRDRVPGGVLRAVAFVPYALDTAPSQRFRLEQWEPLLRQSGVEVEFRPFSRPSLTLQLYQPGRAFAKAAGLASALLAQRRRIPAKGSFDIAIVHRSMSLVGPAFLERRLARVLPFVYDFDDAIHLPNTSKANQAFGWLKYPEKTAEICGLASAVTVGNEYLAEYAHRYNRDVTVVPSSVDVSAYTPGAGHPARTTPVIGWMGSSTSQALMEPFASDLARIPEAGFKLRLVSDRRPVDFSFPFEWRAWSKETEVDELRDFDIGIMPLPDTEWAKGKCAMKVLQYMGVGVPSIASSVGGNLEVIRDGENGLLVAPGEAWIEKIRRLAHDPSLARRLGAAGRDTVMTRYSAEVCARRFAEVLIRVARS